MQNNCSFVKYHSLKNDFIIFEWDELFSTDRARTLCDRHAGVGADGILLYQETVEPFMFIFWVQNADGSDGGFSGNGARCLAAYLFEKYQLTQVILKTKTKVMQCFKKDALVTTQISLGKVLEKTKVFLDQKTFNAFYIEVGNPHLLFFNNMNKTFFLEHILEIKKQLKSEQNISLVEVVDKGFFITTDERGVGLTQGCSSAALAFLTLLKSDFFMEKNFAQVINLFMPGGELMATFNDQSVELSARAFFVFEGTIKI